VPSLGGWGEDRFLGKAAIGRPGILRSLKAASGMKQRCRVWAAELLYVIGSGMPRLLLSRSIDLQLSLPMRDDSGAIQKDQDAADVAVPARKLRKARRMEPLLKARYARATTEKA